MLVAYLDENKIRNSADMISMYDLDLRITCWNPVCERKYKVTESKAMGKKLTEIFPFLEGDYRLNCIRDAIELGKSFYFPGMTYHYSEGRYYQAITPLKRGDKSIVGALNVVRDESDIISPPLKKDLLLPILNVTWPYNEVKHLIE